MTDQAEAIRQQQAVIDALGNLYVQACPGAGKTRTVVSRFIASAERHVGRGIAVVSFTNRAADEVVQRCSALARYDLLQHPHFMGTLDRFIGTYIVRPFGSLGGPIRIIDSWDSLDVSVSAGGGNTVSLDEFSISPDGVLRFEPDDEGPSYTPQQRAWIERSANEQHRVLVGLGYLSCADARSYAVRLMRADPRIARLLQHRFGEVIVDEAQDCSAEDLEVLGFLRQARIEISMVCDPHQAIYEWRGANPDGLQEFVAGFQPLALNGNWRSNAAVCAFASSIKGGLPDVAVGDGADDDTPVHLLPYSGAASADLGAAFAALIAQKGLRPADGVVLAHSPYHASRAVGADMKDPTSRAGRLAKSALIATDPVRSIRIREAAYDRLARLLLAYVGVPTTGHATDRAAETAGIDLRSLRTASVGLAHEVAQLPTDMLTSDWVGEARDRLASCASMIGGAATSGASFMPIPRGKGGTPISEVLGIGELPVSIPFGTIHGAKGTEAAAVMVVIPRDFRQSTRTAELVSAWEQQSSSEPLRVLYVGGTRAKRLLVLATPEAVYERVRIILAERSVPFVGDPAGR